MTTKIINFYGNRKKQTTENKIAVEWHIFSKIIIRKKNIEKKVIIFK